jgi:ABC-2 type transport system permease protein
MKNLRIIYRYSANAFQQSLAHPLNVIFFLVSKVVRYGMFLFFMFALFNGLNIVAGYTPYQILLFYLVFNLIDTTAQLLFREVYRFRPLVVSGGFDMVLAKPLNPLIRVLIGGPDLIDLGMLIIILGAIIYVSSNYLHPSGVEILVFTIMVFNSLLLSAALHIIVLAIGVLTLSVDHIVMIYRDLTSLMRIPVDLFTNPLRSFLTFIIPLGIMFTFPAKFLFGLLAWPYLLLAFAFGVTFFYLAIKFWNFSLKHYQSAGS